LSLKHIELTAIHWDAMVVDVTDKHPFEACGLLGGTGTQVKEVISVTNVLQSSTRYRMDPREQIQAMQRFDELGLSLLGIYHSHVAGPPGLSQIDIEEALYPQSAYLVWSNMHSKWVCHAFIVENQQVEEIPILVQD
jgi:proteasome lid subunit RPN8/RPN11